MLIGARELREYRHLELCRSQRRGRECVSAHYGTATTRRLPAVFPREDLGYPGDIEVRG